MKALSGTFTEATVRSLKIVKASPLAFSLLLDYVYGIYVVDVLKKVFGLARDVLCLSYRCEIEPLTSIDATAALLQASVENCMTLYQMFEEYGCFQKHALLIYIGQRLEKVSGLSESKILSIEDLLTAVFFRRRPWSPRWDSIAPLENGRSKTRNSKNRKRWLLYFLLFTSSS